ncbi:MAG: hypothetical protein Q9160_003069 [Pyrenula sp. 1 TL-2023]
MASGQGDWNMNKDFFNFTRGRFVSREEAQMAMRRIEFDMNALCSVAAKAVGAHRCINVNKCPDGLYNKFFVLTMNDGREVIAKVPNPNAGIRAWTTASEAATMVFARETLNTPAPKIYAWNCSANENPVGAEYIIMEKMSGVPLARVRQRMELTDKLKIIFQIHKLQQSWLSYPFEQIGSLYFREFMPKTSRGSIKADVQGPMSVSERYVVRRILEDHVIIPLSIVTGSNWRILLGKLPLEYYNAAADRESLAVQRSSRFPTQLTMICGPRLYQPTSWIKEAAITDFKKVLGMLLPTDAAISTPYLWHNDLHAENIFVDEIEPTIVTGIIDWQSARIAPLFEHTLIPGILDYDGPEIENLEQPELPPNYAELSQEEQAEQVKMQFNRALVVAYRRLVKGKSSEIHSAVEHQSTSEYTMLHISRRIFSIGEAHLRALLVDLKEDWATLPAVRAFKGQPPAYPLEYSSAEVEEIELDAEAADIGIQIMNDLRDFLADKWPDQAAVRHEDYGETRSLLRNEKQMLIRKLELNEQEKREFERLWPFDD